MLRMIQMSAGDFEKFREASVLEYASELSKSADLEFKEAHRKALTSFEALLPDGIETKKNHFYKLTDGAEQILGHLWFSIRDVMGKETLFICDISVRPEARGKGCGTFMLSWLEGEARRLGQKEISLHVFGHNQGAIKLYERAGYEITNLHMRKKI